MVLLFRPAFGARHDVFVHLCVRGRVFLIDQFFQLLHAGIIQFPDQPVGFRQLAVEDFVRQDGRARLYILEKQDFFVDLTGGFVFLRGFVRERGIVFDIHARFLEIAQRFQAFDGGFIISAVARLQAPCVHDIFAAVLKAVQIFKSRDGFVVVTGLYVGHGFVVGILHLNLRGFARERGVGFYINGGLFEVSKRFEAADCCFVITGFAGFQCPRIGDIAGAVFEAVKALKRCDGFVITTGFHIGDSIIVGISHLNLRCFTRERGIGFQINGGFLEVSKRFEAADCRFIVAGCARFQCPRIGDVLGAVLVSIQRFERLDGRRIAAVSHIGHGLFVRSLLTDRARAQPKRQHDGQQRQCELLCVHDIPSVFRVYPIIRVYGIECQQKTAPPA